MYEYEYSCIRGVCVTLNEACYKSMCNTQGGVLEEYV